MENVITLGKLIGLFLFCPPSSLLFFENFKNKRNDLALPVTGTIFLVTITNYNNTDICRFVCLSWAKMRRRNYVAKHAHAQSQFWAIKTDQ